MFWELGPLSNLQENSLGRRVLAGYSFIEKKITEQVLLPCGFNQFD